MLRHITSVSAHTFIQELSSELDKDNGNMNVEEGLDGKAVQHATAKVGKTGDEEVNDEEGLDGKELRNHEVASENKKIVEEGSVEKGFLEEERSEESEAYSQQQREILELMASYTQDLKNTYDKLSSGVNEVKGGGGDHVECLRGEQGRQGLL